RPRRPRGRQRACVPADAPARPSGDARPDRGRPRRLLRERDRSARAMGLPPIRAAREPHRVGPRPAGRRGLRGAARGDCTTPRGAAARGSAAGPGSAAKPRHEAVRILGPAPAPLALVRGRYRFRLLVKSTRGFDLSAYLREWLAVAPKPKGSLRINIDVDPQS